MWTTAAAGQRTAHGASDGPPATTSIVLRLDRWDFACTAWMLCGAQRGRQEGCVGRCTNSRISGGPISCRALSTPLAVSTAQGRTVAIAMATLAGVNPPASTSGAPSNSGERRQGLPVERLAGVRRIARGFRIDHHHPRHAALVVAWRRYAATGVIVVARGRPSSLPAGAIDARTPAARRRAVAPGPARLHGLRRESRRRWR